MCERVSKHSCVPPEVIWAAQQILLYYQQIWAEQTCLFVQSVAPPLQIKSSVISSVMCWSSGCSQWGLQRVVLGSAQLKVQNACVVERNTADADWEWLSAEMFQL